MYWPPDSLALFFFFWGYVKALVNEVTVYSSENLVARIVAPIREVRDMSGIFASVRFSVHQRCEACIKEYCVVTIAPDSFSDHVLLRDSPLSKCTLSLLKVCMHMMSLFSFFKIIKYVSYIL